MFRSFSCEFPLEIHRFPMDFAYGFRLGSEATAHRRRVTLSSEDVRLVRRLRQSGSPAMQPLVGHAITRARSAMDLFSEFILIWTI